MKPDDTCVAWQDCGYLKVAVIPGLQYLLVGGNKLGFGEPDFHIYP